MLFHLLITLINYSICNSSFAILEDVGGGRDVSLGVKTVDGMGQSTGGEGSVF